MTETTNNQPDSNENELQNNSINEGQHTNDTNQQVNAQQSSDDGEGESTENETSAAVHAANNPNVKQASSFRDRGRQPARANEAADRNDTGSGGLSAGGVKSGSSLQ